MDGNELLTVLIMRLDDGPWDENGQFRCTWCSWECKGSRESCPYHAKMVHVGKAKVERENLRDYKGSVEERSKAAERKKRWREQEKVSELTSTLCYVHTACRFTVISRNNSIVIPATAQTSSQNTVQ